MSWVGQSILVVAASGQSVLGVYQHLQVQMAAERILLAAALAGDPWAARFVLLSESCIPLYPASVVWMQLISQPLSRIDACMRPEDPEDYNKRMGYRYPRPFAPPPPLSRPRI